MDLPFFQLPLERVTHDRRRTLRLLLRNRATDGVLRAALRNENDRDVLFAQRAEEAMRGARDTDHARAFEVDERDALDAGDALYGQCRSGFRADERPDLLRGERVTNPDGDATAHGRSHGLRMNHLRTEVSQLHRLVVGQRVDDSGIGHAARVG